jgi:hypothetical protein
MNGRVPATVVIASDCAAYTKRALEIVREVTALFTSTLEANVGTDDLRCRFTGPTWSNREQKHVAWCKALPPARSESAITAGRDASGARRMQGRRHPAPRRREPGDAARRRERRARHHDGNDDARGKSGRVPRRRRVTLGRSPERAL